MLIEQPQSQKNHDDWRRAFSLYAALVATLGMWSWTSITSMANIWLNSAAYGHGIVILPISAALIIAQRTRWMLHKPQIWPAALLGLIFAICIVSAGRALDIQIAEHVGVVALFVACTAMIFGRRLFNAWLFPLCFLFFMVPFGESLRPLLQEFTANAATFLLNTSGVQASMESLIISIAAGQFSVDAGCAGLRFVLAALVIATLFGHYAFCSWQSRALFTFMAVILAILTNFIRVFTIVYVAALTNGTSGLIHNHVLLGWVFYAVAIVGLITVGARFSPTTSRTIEAS